MTRYQTIHHCLDKPAFKTVGDATRDMYKKMIQRGVLIPCLNVYECKFGTHYHYGKDKK